ncbi:MAG: M20/M25/M40 family metallo-hydrolase [Flavobacteriaceae bacterium]
MKKILLYIVLSGILCPINSSYGQRLSRTEKKIVEKVKAMDEASIDFLEKVVNINSGTMNLEGVKKVGDEFSTAFQTIGFETEWIEMPKEMNRAGHLFARIQGKKGKKLLLIGHLDTVFEADSPFQTFERNGTMAYAPGGNDMKGGNVVILYALKALHDLNLLKDATITVAYTGDEERTGKPLSISRKDLIEAAKASDIALGFETATGFNNATIARRGASGWKVETVGKRAHSSGVFSERTGAGAIFELSRILHQFYKEVRGEEYLTFNPGNILGGTFVNYETLKSSGTAYGKSNVVAQTAVVHGGLRFISETQKENARAKMRTIVDNHLPSTNATITFTDSYPAMGPTAANKALLNELSAVSEALGFGEVEAYDPGRRGAADISFVADYVSGLDGLGSMGTGAHTPQETVDLATFNALIQRTAVFIYRLTRD